MPGAGTAESLTALTRADFVEFHKRHFVPNNALLAVVGDISPAEAMAGLEKHFGAWKPGEVPPPEITEAPDATRRVIVIDKKGSVQTEIRVGHIAIPRKHPDYEAIDQAVKILGGEGANRLQQVLRSQKQLTYGASADLDTFKWSGAVVAETDTQTVNTAQALRLVVDEFTRLQRERVNDGELEGAQDYMVGHFPLTIEVPDQIATQVLNQLFYELPVDDLPKYRERILKVTPDEIQRVARWFIRPAQLSVVLVGDADKFVNDLKGVGFPNFERIPIERLDMLSADFLKRSGASRPE
jgi:zinc protease